jgi:uncharacterized membrane protein SpoIIM required for sporulation
LFSTFDFSLSVLIFWKNKEIIWYNFRFRARTIFGFSVSLILINMASILEKADENLLPAVYKEVSEAFNAGPTELGYLTFIMNFVQSVSSPFAGRMSN